jgi:hypothetical protein
VVYRDAVGEYVPNSLSSRSVMMGCRCDDTDSDGIVIRCGYAFYERVYYEVAGDSSDDLVSYVTFQIPSTAKYMKCISTEITVKTLRWPSTRISNRPRYTDTFAQGVADAAIWVKPRCSSSNNEAICLKEFRNAACFPYCLALRASGSGSARLVLQVSLFSSPLFLHMKMF